MAERIAALFDNGSVVAGEAAVAADDENGNLGIGGFAAAAVDELVATARADGGQADDARAALALLLRLADRGNVA